MIVRTRVPFVSPKPQSRTWGNAERIGVRRKFSSDDPAPTNPGINSARLKGLADGELLLKAERAGE